MIIFGITLALDSSIMSVYILHDAFVSHREAVVILDEPGSSYNGRGGSSPYHSGSAKDLAC